MKANPVAGNVLGTMGTICWTGQLIPQVWKNYRDKKTAGLSPWLMFIWGSASSFLGVYAIVQKLNIPLQIQPQLFGFLCLVSWGQCLYYDPNRQSKKTRSIIIAVVTMIVAGALEVLFVLVSRPAVEHGIDAPVKLFGILSVLAIAGGLLPQYWEIYKLKEVMGVSYTFICIDMLGGILNALSLAFAEHFDGLAAASYIAVTVMDSVIIFAAIILNPRARKRRRQADAAAASTQDLESGRESSTTSDTLQVVDSPSDNASSKKPPTTVGDTKDEKATNARVDEKGAENEIPSTEVSGDLPSTAVSSTAVSCDHDHDSGSISEMTRAPGDGDTDPLQFSVTPISTPPVEVVASSRESELEEGGYQKR